MARASQWSAIEFMPWFNSVALAAKKPFEYNYVIPPRADGSSQVWEYAGPYQAAHSEGENGVAIGVLFAIGVSNHPSYRTYDPTRPTVWEECTPAMIHAYQWLRDINLEQSGQVLPGVAELEHFLMPGANTACPGEQVTQHGGQLDAPYSNGGELVTVEYFKLFGDTLTIWATADRLNAVRLDGSTAEARGVDPFAVPVISAAQAATYTFHAGLPFASVR